MYCQGWNQPEVRLRTKPALCCRSGLRVGALLVAGSRIRLLEGGAKLSGRCESGGAREERDGGLKDTIRVDCMSRRAPCRRLGGQGEAGQARPIHGMAFCHVNPPFLGHPYMAFHSG